MTTLLIRDKCDNENSCEKELKWENLSGTEDTDEIRDLKDDKDSKDKTKSLGSDIISSVKVNNYEWIVLVGLANTVSSKILGKLEAINEKDVVIKTIRS